MIPFLRKIDAGVKKWRLFTIFPSGRAAQYPEFEMSGEETEELMKFIVDTRKEGRIHPSFCCEGFMAGYEGAVRDFFFRLPGGCECGIGVA